MWFVLLRTIVATDAAIGGSFVVWHFVFHNEEAGVGAFDVTEALEEAPKFIGKAVSPDVLVFV
jgi:hypothetical protein